MEPETQEHQKRREARLKIEAEKLGLVAVGSVVVVPLPNKPIAIDASAADVSNLAASLLYLVYNVGREVGGNEVRGDLARLLKTA